MYCRILPYEVADGPGNMALDEALLGSTAGEGMAAVRTYGWTVPTLSLGYFQGIAEAEADPRWEKAEIVRRPTGGGAIWHDREVTYAVAIPREHPLARRPAGLYQALHGAIAGVLAADGVKARARGEEAGGNRRNRPFLCFTDRDPEDIVVAERKVVGSAQRRRSGAVLQHGSILLSTSPTTPELPGLRELAEFEPDALLWSRSLAVRLSHALGLPVVEDSPSEAERERADALMRRTYRDPAWTRRR